MKSYGNFWLALFMFAATLFPVQAVSGDMRVKEREAAAKKMMLLEKLAQEKQQAQEAAARSREKIVSDQNALESALAALKRDIGVLEKENRQLEQQRAELARRENDLKEELGEVDAVTRELVGNIRINARDLDTLINQGLQGAVVPGRGDEIRKLMDKSAYPGMDDIQALVALFEDEAKRSGEVRLIKGPIVNRTGETVTADILIIGNFNAAYRLGDEIGFLNYDPGDRRLYALSNLPSWHTRRCLSAYMAGGSDVVPVDISKGGALRQLSHRITFWTQITKGGPIVWPILGILVFAVFLFSERVVFILRKKINGDKFMEKINGCITEDAWEKCREVCDREKGRPLSNIIRAGIDFRQMPRQDLENAMQEAILREIPPMERFLSTLGMLAAIAPLLGLLGTVTGMINTFHVITFYGTGDPRMMSGGISEALVTTMLGLMVAIPIMFGHTILSRRVENIIAEMEEKAVSFINRVHKAKTGGPDVH